MTFNNFPFVRYLLLFIIGILCYPYLRDYYHILVSVFCVSCLSTCIAIYFKKHQFFRISIHVFLLTLSSIIAHIHNPISKNSHYLNAVNFNQYLVEVTSRADEKPKTWKAEAKILSIKVNNFWKPATGKVILYFDKKSNTIPDFGEYYHINQSPREIEPLKNPYEFNYKNYMANKGVYSHHFLRQNDFRKVGYNSSHWFKSYIYTLSENALYALKTHITNSEALGVAAALLTGVNTELDTETLKSFSITGAIHVLSVSGSHVGILLLTLNFLFINILKLKPNSWYVSILSIIAIWIFAIYTGLSPSVSRAALMFTFLQVASTINRSKNNLNILAISAIILLIINPNYIYDVGFQLSYLAMLGIFVAYSPLQRQLEFKNRILQSLWQVTVLSFSAQLFTFPLSAYYFHQFPSYFLLANPVVAVFSFIILPLGLIFLASSPIHFLAKFLGYLENHLIVLFNNSISFLASLPGATIKGFALDIYDLFALYALVTILSLFFYYQNLKALKLATVLVVLLITKNTYKKWQDAKQSEITFHYIPNGSGISILNKRQARFYADSNTFAESRIYDFHLKNYYDAKSISNFSQDTLLTNAHISFNNRYVLWISHPYTSIPVNTQILLLSNNSLKNLSDVPVTIKKIILDGTYKKYQIEKLMQQNKNLSLPIVSLYNTGSITIQ
jgi:competence protein ComEC